VKISDISIKRRAAVFIIVISIFIIGILNISSMNRELIPNIMLPELYVVTVYKGAGAEEVEDKVTRILERKFASLQDLKNMYSTSSDSRSIIHLSFNDNVNIDNARNEVDRIASQAKRNMPDRVEDPVMHYGGSTDLDILTVAMESDIEMDEQVEFVENDVIPSLSNIEGVGRVNFTGFNSRKVKISLRMDDLYANKLSIMDVYQAVSSRTVSIPAGTIEYQKRKLNLKTVSESITLEQIGNIIIGVREDVPVYLMNIADISLEFDAAEKEVTLNGESVVWIGVSRRDDGNAIRIIEEVKRQLRVLEKEKGGAVNFQILTDDSRMINSSIKSILRSAGMGIIFAVLVIFVFLHDLRATLIIASSIPLSILGGIVGMKLMGVTINFLSLCGITVAMGMVVDDSIVVLESIHKQLDEGHAPDKAASLGATIVGSAVISSTTTTIVVFIPLLMMTGIVGIFFKDVSLTLAFAIASSTTAAISVIPALSSRILHPKALRNKKIIFRPMKQFIERILNKLEKLYRDALNVSLNYLWAVISVCILVLIITVLSVFLFGISFLPPTDYSIVELSIDMPRDYSIEQSRDKLKEVEDLITSEVPEIENRLTILQRNSIFGYLLLYPVAEREKKSQRSSYQVMEHLQERLNEEITDIDARLVNGGFDSLMGYVTGGSGFRIEIEGNDLDKLYKVAVAIEDLMKQDPEIYKTSKSMTMDDKEIIIRLDPDRMGSLGVIAEEAGLVTMMMFRKSDVGAYNRDGKLYDMELEADIIDQPVSKQSLENLYVRSLSGNFVPFANFANIQFEPVPGKIDHYNRKIVVSVTGFTKNQNLRFIQQRINTKIDEMSFPHGIQFYTRGSQEMINTMIPQIIKAVTLAIFLVYAVMVIQFNRFIQPLIIMGSIPFAMIGVIIGLMIFGSDLSMIAFLGIIALAGIVVNNAIVLVDYINWLRVNSELSLRDAVLTGAATRLRPILMTTLTTMFGVLPIAIAKGNGAEIYNPLGQAIFGGMISSTIVTLVLIPALYYKIELFLLWLPSWKK
jgi:hydrophobic/amphiphilic exporter-1 (mainly G- bacteria), HAE1 family